MITEKQGDGTKNKASEAADAARKEGKWPRIQERLFKMVSVGVTDDALNFGYDIVSTAALVVNLLVSIFGTYDSFRGSYGELITAVEAVTVLFFTVDYVLRILTADNLYPAWNSRHSILKYVFSVAGIIDLFSFLPYYLPFFFPAGAVTFRMFRVIRIFRLFRINAYYDSLNVITEVLESKKQQLLSSVFIILTLMISSSLCMYSLEHEAQPEIFANAFSGIWWSASTLLTVGYGDIYPITPLGKVFGILITFLGVGMVAIPTGIISAGFVEQYTRLKNIGEYGSEQDVSFISVKVTAPDPWIGSEVRSLGLPRGMLIAAIHRGKEAVVPRGNIRIRPGDVLIIGAENVKTESLTQIQEIHLLKNHPWVGQSLKDLDISRQSFIIMIRRDEKTMIPNGRTILRPGDAVFMYTRRKVGDYDLEPEKRPEEN
ncbi:MAG: TrkA C-terminal domain-containing protein [Bacillota bacterium]|nr:TrkA C-terminal domain-containing protein [Bacillota bacterium]